MNKKKRQQKLQSRSANARQKQQEREARRLRLAEGAEKRWQHTQRLLMQMGATPQPREEERKGMMHIVYLVTHQEQTVTLPSRSSVQRWIKRLRCPAREAAPVSE